MNYFSYHYLLSNKFSPRLYSFSLILSEIPFLLLLPLQIMFGFTQSESITSSITIDTTNYTLLSPSNGPSQLNYTNLTNETFTLTSQSYVESVNLNYILKLGTIKYFLYITDVLNGLLILSLIFIIILFFKYSLKLSISNKQNITSFILSAFIIKLIGTFLFSYLISIQTLVIRCAFQSVCYSITGYSRVASNIVGLLISFIFYQGDLRLSMMRFP